MYIYIYILQGDFKYRINIIILNKQVSNYHKKLTRKVV